MLIIADAASSCEQINTTYLLIAIALGLLLGMIFSKNGKIDKSKIACLPKKEFLDMKRKGTLIDVRKKEEFEKSKIIGAKNYPNASGKNLSSIRHDIPIFIYDKNGKSAYRIAKQYVKNNACMVYYLKGGFDSYINE